MGKTLPPFVAHKSTLVSPQCATVSARFCDDKNDVAGASKEWRMATEAVAPQD